MHMKRRNLLLAALGSATLNPSWAQTRIPIADAHNHIGLLRRNSDAVFRLGALLKEAGVSLLSWTVVPDGPFLRFTPNGIEQGRTLAKGDLKASFDNQLSNATKGLMGNGARVLKTVADLDEAAKGEPFVVLTSEGADFLEGTLDDLPSAFERGIRHIQLVHYIQNPVGDLQTEKPMHNGLSAFGKQVIQAMNTTGILVDLAHSTGPSIDQALEISTKPMIWSHGWISPTQGRFNDSIGLLARRISWLNARQIVDKGGVIGLWSVGISDGAKSRYPEYPIAFNPQLRYKTYATGIAQMVKELGADHVCFGTDIEGVGPIGVVNHYRELRQVVDLLSDAGLSDAEVFKVCIGNYARVLKTAMNT